MVESRFPGVSCPESRQYSCEMAIDCIALRKLLPVAVTGDVYICEFENCYLECKSSSAVPNHPILVADLAHLLHHVWNCVRR